MSLSWIALGGDGCSLPKGQETADSQEIDFMDLLFGDTNNQNDEESDVTENSDESSNDSDSEDDNNDIG